MEEKNLERRLTEILADIVRANATSRGTKPGDLDPAADFALLGINSVDLMEFVLRVEKEFRVEILDELLPDELPTSIVGWAEFLGPRLERSAAS